MNREKLEELSKIKHMAQAKFLSVLGKKNPRCEDIEWDISYHVAMHESVIAYQNYSAAIEEFIKENPVERQLEGKKDGNP